MPIGGERSAVQNPFLKYAQQAGWTYLSYGSSPPGSNRSFTEREYDAATLSNRPRLMFLAPDDFALPASLREDDQANVKQRSFRKKVSNDHIRASFRSPDDLAAGVVTALHNWERENLVRDDVAGTPEPLEPADKLLAGLNVQSFFVKYGDPPADFRAADYIRLIAVPRSSNNIRLDNKAQQRFEQLVRKSFLEIHGFDEPIVRGQYHQIQSRNASRSSTHRVWCLWNSGAVGYTANLDTAREVPVGDLVLHYIFFWRLIEPVLPAPGDIVVDFQLMCPRVRFTSHFPDPHGNRNNYDRVHGVHFEQRHPYLREHVQNVDELHLPLEGVEDMLADRIAYQLQESTAVRIDSNRWLEAVTNLFRQTGFQTWGKCR